MLKKLTTKLKEALTRSLNFYEKYIAYNFKSPLHMFFLGSGITSIALLLYFNLTIVKIENNIQKTQQIEKEKLVEYYDEQLFNLSVSVADNFNNTSLLVKKMSIVEASLSPENTKWAKTKLIREATRKSIEEFRILSAIKKTEELTVYAAAVVEYSEEYDVPVPLILAVTRQESAFRPQVVSHAGAVGLMQVMPSTAKEIAEDLGVKHYNLFKIKDNTRFGIFYLSKMLDEFDRQLPATVAAYNAGPVYVKKVISGEYDRLPSETNDYLEKILGENGFFQYYSGLGID